MNPEMIARRHMFQAITERNKDLFKLWLFNPKSLLEEILLTDDLQKFLQFIFELRNIGYNHSYMLFRNFVPIKRSIQDDNDLFMQGLPIPKDKYEDPFNVDEYLTWIIETNLKSTNKYCTQYLQLINPDSVNKILSKLNIDKNSINDNLMSNIMIKPEYEILICPFILYIHCTMNDVIECYAEYLFSLRNELYFFNMFFPTSSTPKIGKYDTPQINSIYQKRYNDVLSKLY